MSTYSILGLCGSLRAKSLNLAALKAAGEVMPAGMTLTIATIDENAKLTPIIYGSAGNLVTAAYEKDGKRLIMDGGFTRLAVNWDDAGTARYVKNAASWLVNSERFKDMVAKVAQTP